MLSTRKHHLSILWHAFRSVCSVCDSVWVHADLSATSCIGVGLRNHTFLKDPVDITLVKVGVPPAMCDI